MTTSSQARDQATRTQTSDSSASSTPMPQHPLAHLAVSHVAQQFETRPLRLKLLSDGSPYGARVVNADTGQLLDGVTSVSVFVSPCQPPRAVLHLTGIELDLVATDDQVVTHLKVVQQQATTDDDDNGHDEHS